MIRQDIRLEAEQWDITVFYAVTHYEMDEIMKTLIEAGCEGRNLELAYRNLTAGMMDTGLCFSGKGKSVVVISVASSARQFMNSMAHELHHLSSHIAQAVGYDLLGEEVCYMTGEIAERMHTVAGRYLCECCR